MAETEDINAHLWSLPGSSPFQVTTPLRMLDGHRFSFYSNRQFKMPTDVYEHAASDPDALAAIATKFITEHYHEQVYRIVALERYYSGDNDIHYWFANKARNRADNRIASAITSYITNIRVGYTFGTPLKFTYNVDEDEGKNAGEDLTKALDAFNQRSDEPYHEKIMKKRLSVTGRAYEILYVRPDTNDPMVKPIDPSNAFVVYDATIEQHSLFAVYYYPVRFDGDDTWYVTIYTDENTYYYKPMSSPTSELVFDHAEPHYFDAVPITEYINNDERMGDWERELDAIDAYDRSISEMANNQEDFSNSVLVLTGDVDTPTHKDANGNVVKDQPSIDRHSLIMWLKPRIVGGGLSGQGTTVITPTAQYLTKSLPANDWKIYTDALMESFHKYTNTPDVNDQNFASNASGVAMSYKLWGSDQERAIQESLYQRGLMRRIRLLTAYWQKVGAVPATDDPNHITPKFTANLPKNDAETITTLTGLSNTGDFSKETIREMATGVTGVKPAEEANRVREEQDEDPTISFASPFDAQPGQGVAVQQDSKPDDQQPDDAKPADDAGQVPSGGKKPVGGDGNGEA
ncbi:prophage Lp1 protein 39 [Lacticaseibacillus pantheris DSM 15945 = JCM 12539 = NBRC 106106]|uniref:Prophage Lp1 protein 39 n=1 Tax=Lacticaseibacillus pantheris DSM 15945 = JCM 12539 = NBRC 106106 TaxID=1423783 RepID=A0A0R1TZ73_9LACO|nr:phage portal protein [Lacticaseibacillus pantheris]KRL86422.1 prophage Lp1 protein 39 [Lacticaseibacillus pantheris DSM 15945 = JCM 12539 = NBRC 106106]